MECNRGLSRKPQLAKADAIDLWANAVARHPIYEKCALVRLTVSICPDNILSTVVATFPPWRWKSHMMVLRSIWGQTSCTLCTMASLALIAD